MTSIRWVNKSLTHTSTCGEQTISRKNQNAYFFFFYDLNNPSVLFLSQTLKTSLINKSKSQLLSKCFSHLQPMKLHTAHLPSSFKLDFLQTCCGVGGISFTAGVIDWLSCRLNGFKISTMWTALLQPQSVSTDFSYIWVLIHKDIKHLPQLHSCFIC